MAEPREQKEPVEIIREGRWAAEVHIAPGMIGNVADERYVFKMVVDELIDSIFDATGGPVDLKISVKEIRSGDYDPNTFEALMPGWRCRVDGEKRRPGRQGIE